MSPASAETVAKWEKYHKRIATYAFFWDTTPKSAIIAI